MPNRNRQRGDYFERRTKETLEADGWLVIRSAGSLGPADLVALKKNHPPRIISCKLDGYLRRKEIAVLISAAAKSGAMAILASRDKPGVVSLAIVTKRFGTDVTDRIALADMRMPATRRKPAGYPADPDQLTIYDALE